MRAAEAAPVDSAGVPRAEPGRKPQESVMRRRSRRSSRPGARGRPGAARGTRGDRRSGRSRGSVSLPVAWTWSPIRNRQRTSPADHEVADVGQCAAVDRDHGRDRPGPRRHRRLGGCRRRPARDHSRLARPRRARDRRCADRSRAARRARLRPARRRARWRSPQVEERGRGQAPAGRAPARPLRRRDVDGSRTTAAAMAADHATATIAAGVWRPTSSRPLLTA